VTVPRFISWKNPLRSILPDFGKQTFPDALLKVGVRVGCEVGIAVEDGMDGTVAVPFTVGEAKPASVASTMVATRSGLIVGSGPCRGKLQAARIIIGRTTKTPWTFMGAIYSERSVPNPLALARR
jgi:hypothetical protein